MHKVNLHETKHGDGGEHLLVRGENAQMRYWHNEEPADTADKPMHANDYETLGFVVSGRVDLVFEDETLELGPGDSYLVPRGKQHTYRVRETLNAVEVISPV